MWAGRVGASASDPTADIRSFAAWLPLNHCKSLMLFPVSAVDAEMTLASHRAALERLLKMPPR